MSWTVRTRTLAVLLALVLVAGCAPSDTSPAPTGPAPSPTEPAVACAAPDVAGRWWDGRVFYEVFVRSFADSDGDGIGDFRGLTERLDYLNDGDPATTDDLGVTGIWLMPVFAATSYHGYDVTDYRAIDPEYGTDEDFRAFLDAAAARGIEVILDLVLNHTGIEHPWFAEARDPASPRSDWYVWADEFPGWAGPGGQPVWHADGDRWYLGQFWSGMPDLNLRNPAVTDELVDIARYWLEEYGVSGFRLDAIKHLVEDGQALQNTPETIAWLEDFHARVKAVAPEALLVGEVYDVTRQSARYVPAAVDLAFDFEVAGKILLGARIGEAGSLATAQRDALAFYEDGAYAAFITNHDQARVMTELGSVAKARVAASVLLTNPGVPFVYYGEEIGMAGGKPDPRIRTPLPWTAEGPGFGFTSGEPWEPFEPGWETANVADQLADPDSLLSHYRALVRVRAAHPALRRGSTFLPLRSSAPTVYAFLVQRQGDAVAVVLNLGDRAAPAPMLELRNGVACRFGRATVAYADGFGTALAAGTLLDTPATGADGTFAGWRPVDELPPLSTLIIALDD